MASSKGEFEDHSEAFFQVVGATESRVGLHNSGELDLLFVGQVFFWVLVAKYYRRGGPGRPSPFYQTRDGN